MIWDFLILFLAIIGMCSLLSLFKGLNIYVAMFIAALISTFEEFIFYHLRLGYIEPFTMMRTLVFFAAAMPISQFTLRIMHKVKVENRDSIIAINMGFIFIFIVFTGLALLRVLLLYC